MNESEWLSSNALFLPGWVLSIIVAMSLSVVSSFLPGVFSRLKQGLFPLLALPAFVMCVLFMVHGFELMDRPIMHWVFQRDAQDSLHIGFAFDTLTLLVTVVFGLTLLALTILNRPSVQVTAAMTLGWVGLCITASSKTFWTASLGVGICLFAKILPILSASGEKTGESTIDRLWMAGAKRGWVGLLLSMFGASGLVAHGIHLDFTTKLDWAELLSSFSTQLSGGLFLGGLLVHFAPFINAPVLHDQRVGHLEEEVFVFESSSAWAAVIILFRMMPNIKETPWAIYISVTALIFLTLSIFTLAFLETKRSAIYHWLSSTPLLVLCVLPFTQETQGFSLAVGAMIAFCGLLVCLDHMRKPVEVIFTAFFFVGSFGFAGWLNSATTVEFFSRLENMPALVGACLIIWTLFGALGFRIVLRGGDSATRNTLIPKWVCVGFLILIGFGPILSGRFLSGALPEVSDWIEGAKNWAWIKQPETTSEPITWLGFAVVHGMILVAALLAAFVSATAELFPFSQSNPRGLRVSKELFGLLWLQRQAFSVLSVTGNVLAERIPNRILEGWIPKASAVLFEKLRWLGEWVEGVLDFLTSPVLAKLFSAPSKFVQWFHGGNVRLYGWFALAWILIISIYLTR